MQRFRYASLRKKSRHMSLADFVYVPYSRGHRLAAGLENSPALLRSLKPFPQSSLTTARLSLCRNGTRLSPSYRKSTLLDRRLSCTSVVLIVFVGIHLPKGSCWPWRPY